MRLIGIQALGPIPGDHRDSRSKKDGHKKSGVWYHEVVFPRGSKYPTCLGFLVPKAYRFQCFCGPEALTLGYLDPQRPC